MALLGLLVAMSGKIFPPQNVDSSKAMPAFSSELQKYLDLSDDQIAKILRLNREHDEMASRKRSEIADLRMQASQSGKGDPYRQMEVLSREISESLRATHSNIRALLNVSQLSRLDALRSKCDKAGLDLLKEACKFRLLEGSEGRSDGHSPFGGTTPIFNSDTGTRRETESNERQTKQKEQKKNNEKSACPQVPPPA